MSTSLQAGRQIRFLLEIAFQAVPFGSDMHLVPVVSVKVRGRGGATDSETMSPGIPKSEKIISADTCSPLCSIFEIYVAPTSDILSYLRNRAKS